MRLVGHHESKSCTRCNWSNKILKVSYQNAVLNSTRQPTTCIPASAILACCAFNRILGLLDHEHLILAQPSPQHEDLLKQVFLKSCSKL